jgi:hypothetical protein
MTLRLKAYVVLIVALLERATSFLVCFPKMIKAPSRNTLLFIGRASNDRSRFEGNQREPTNEELAVMDEMISKLANAKPYELPNAVQRAFRVVSSPKFFLRIAERTDLTKDALEKEKLRVLASNLISTLGAVVSTTEDKLDETAKILEKVVKAAAEPESGEFFVPLLPERIQSMREEFYKLDDNQLDEGFLSTIDSWMNKSYKDGMDLMVGILQKVLQMYAGRKIAQSLARDVEVNSDSRKLFLNILNADADTWGGIISEGVENGVSVDQLQSEVQANMESIVLSLETGSISQRVQAEYLKEISKRITQMN